MATPAERKALLFFGIVAVLGAGVRLWQTRHHSRDAASIEREARRESDDSDAPPTRARHSAQSGGRTKSGGKRTGVRSGSRSKSRNGQLDRDSTSIVDLDRATVSQIDAIGVTPAGIGRLIVADRDSFGPFGSIEELRRVPFLSASTLRKLAPRVTFSRVPRPRNTVIRPRDSAANAPPRRSRRTPRTHGASSRTGT